MKHFIALSFLIVNAVACGSSSSNSDKATEGPLSPNASTVTDANALPSTSPSAAVGTAPAPVAAEEAPVLAEVVAPAVIKEVDATSKTDWAHLDIDTGNIVSASDASWDIAFKRTAIKLNAASVTAVKSAEPDFDAILSVPETGFVTDVTVPGSTIETDGLFFHTGEAWYSYDINVHVIYSQKANYLIKSNSGTAYKLTIADYYNLDRLPAFIQLKWQKIAAPALVGE